MRLSSIFMGMGLLALCSFAQAGDTCDSATTQAELTECSAQAYQSADDKLNEAYQVLVDQLSSNSASLEKLRTAQRAWIGFRDAECAFESSAVEGGSAQPMIRNSCLEVLTEARTETLREHAECEEDDLSCPL
ncbi:lysozyme inhibitor LprI family protein [Vreelandella neptunia]|uniref:Lysozyme inhibitor LprI family protein n=1 Tax=Vreelandella neptunia TaxID=115551 RepID=A0ABS9S9Z9_9GAMM|nr:lysozyme inhibitor LprI family protein [Halomonas neptunia]MCH4812940.1 lysozyme inhibitor LprI family protein [Halomonas neptunia]